MKSVLRSFLGALQRDGDFLSRHPNSVFQSVWNHCAWVSSDLRDHLGRQHNALRARDADGWWIRAIEPPFGLDSRMLWTLRGHIGNEIALAFSHDRKKLATGCMDFTPTVEGAPRDTTARVWDLETGQTVFTLSPGRAFANQRPVGVRAVAFSPDDRVLMIKESGNSEVTLWDASTGAFITAVGSGFDLTQFSDDSRWFAGIILGQYVRSNDDAVVLKELGGGRPRYVQLRFRRGAPGASDQPFVREHGVWVDVTSGTLGLDADGTIISLPLDPSPLRPEWLYFGDVDDRGQCQGGRVRILNRTISARRARRLGFLTAYGRVVRSWLGLRTKRVQPVAGVATSIQIQIDVEGVAVTFEDGTVSRFVGHEASVRTFALSADRTMMSTADKTGTVIVWRVTREEPSTQRSAHPNSQRRSRASLEVSSRRYRFAVVGETHLHVFESGASTALCEIGRPDYFGRTGDATPSGEITAIELSGDESKLAISQYGRGVAVWDLVSHPPSLATDRQLRAATIMRPDGNAVLPHLLCFSEDGTRLFGGTHGPFASYEWEVKTGACLRSSDEFTDPVFLARWAGRAETYLALSRLDLSACSTADRKPLAWLPFALDARFDPLTQSWIVGDPQAQRRYKVVRLDADLVAIDSANEVSA